MDSAEHAFFKDSIKSFDFNKSSQMRQYYLTETIKLSVITGPLYCLSSNLQYLQKGNNEMIKPFNSNTSKSLVDSSLFRPTNTPYRSIIRPFKPSYYTSYRDAFFNLYKQGIQGLYKGNVYRLSFFTLTNELKQLIELNYGHMVKVNWLLRECVLYSLTDVFLHPLLFVESRYSIQNRRPGFRAYKNIISVLEKSGHELYRGALYSIPRNILFVLALNLYFVLPNQAMHIVSIALAHLLSYPILTIQRNLVYSSKSYGYFPNQFHNINNNIPKYIIQNFGIFSLYRGFLSYGLATGLWHYLVPANAKYRFYKNMRLGEEGDIFKINLFEEEEEDE